MKKTVKYGKCNKCGLNYEKPTETCWWIETM